MYRYLSYTQYAVDWQASAQTEQLHTSRFALLTQGSFIAFVCIFSALVLKKMSRVSAALLKIVLFLQYQIVKSVEFYSFSLHPNLANAKIKS
jgi:hypothetical protein